MDSGKELRGYEGHEDTIIAVAVRVWDVEERKQLRTLTGHEGPVWAVAITRDVCRPARRASCWCKVPR